MQKQSSPIFRESRILECPKSMVGRVIGKNGETIKALQIYTGALIQIDQTEDPMKVNVYGSTASLNIAMNMVQDIIQGNFKGFALLRQISSSGNKSVDIKLEYTSEQEPFYAPGYGFVPPSQQFQALSQGDLLPFIGNFGGSANAGQYSFDLLKEMQGQNASQQHYLNSLLQDSYKNKAFPQLNQNNLLQCSNNIRLGDVQLNTPHKSLSPKCSMQYGTLKGMQTPKGQKIHNNWLSLSDPDGKSFYINQLTGETRWQNPGSNRSSTSTTGMYRFINSKENTTISNESQNSFLTHF